MLLPQLTGTVYDAYLGFFYQISQNYWYLMLVISSADLDE